MHIDEHKGSIKKGKDADFVIFDNNINVSYTIVEGDVIYAG
jgi:N-acetylglucosamine-6-phosphate deacetylase